MFVCLAVLPFDKPGDFRKFPKQPFLWRCTLNIPFVSTSSPREDELKRDPVSDNGSFRESYLDASAYIPTFQEISSMDIHEGDY